MTGPDRQVAQPKYEQLAPTHDRWARPAARLRRLAVDRLALKPGEVVLDVGCGTGLSFSLVEERIGPEGGLIGVDPSPDMLAKARERVKRHGYVTTFEGFGGAYVAWGTVERSDQGRESP